MCLSEGSRWLALLLCTLLAACGDSEPATGAASTLPRDAAFANETAQWQQQRREVLLQPDGWTSLVGLHWLELKSHYIGSGPGSGIRLAVGPAKLGLVQQVGEHYWLTPERGAGLTLQAEPLTARVQLKDDTDATPTLVGFDESKGQLGLIRRGERRALRIKHADAPTRLQLGALEYWPADPAWKVDARFIAHPPGTTLPMTDMVGTSTQAANPGVVEFSHDGKVHRLEALGDVTQGLFLVLADRTSGHGSYSAGRYIDAPAPDAEGRLQVDFNRAYSPPCVFTDYATCPLPPPANRLDLAITAGEKAYVRPASVD